jgi:hypothetical protein
MNDNYKYIRAWGRMMGSRDPYIQAQIQKAYETKAPQDAVYWSLDELRWRTLSEVSQNTRYVIENIIMKNGQPV